jgi:hypothetical protein
LLSQGVRQESNYEQIEDDGDWSKSTKRFTRSTKAALPMSENAERQWQSYKNFLAG